jgi:hypothetical protein
MVKIIKGRINRNLFLIVPAWLRPVNGKLGCQLLTKIIIKQNINHK